MFAVPSLINNINKKPKFCPLDLSTFNRPDLSTPVPITETDFCPLDLSAFNRPDLSTPVPITETDFCPLDLAAFNRPNLYFPVPITEANFCPLDLAAFNRRYKIGLYCQQDVSALRLAREVDHAVFYCEQDASLLRSAREVDHAVFYCEQDASLLRSAREVDHAVFYCKQDVISMTVSTVTINPIATDNIIQPPEEQNLVISGTVTNVYDNTTATILINNITYTTSVISNIFSVNIPIADIASWGSSETVTVSVVKNGETYSASTTLSFDLSELFFTPQNII